MSIAAEKGCLGSAIISAEACGKVCTDTELSDYTHDAHKRIFEAIASLDGAGMPVDYLTLSDLLESQGYMQEADYIPKLVTQTPTAANVEGYILSVRRSSARRKVRALAEEIIQDVDSEKPIESILSDINCINIQPPNRKSSFVSLCDAVDGAITFLESPDVPGVKTGYRDLDEMLGGIYPGELILLAARPSMGKTALALSMALDIASREKSKSVLFFEAEMTTQSLAIRSMAKQGSLHLARLMSKRSNSTEIERTAVASSELARVQLEICDKPGLTVSDIRRMCIERSRISPIEAVFIDYLQLIPHEKTKGSTNDAVADQTRRIKLLARELNVPVVLLSQLNRDVDRRDDRTPRMSDLRDSGAIEQDADSILFLLRESVYDMSKPEGEATIIVAKNRNGPIGKARIHWSPTSASFS